MLNKRLDIHLFSNDVKFQILGQLKSEIVEFILDKKPEFEGRIDNTTDILFWKERVKHTERHKKDFQSEEEFYKCLEEIPLIIESPDYISIHPKDESVSFIKDYSRHISVAIRVSLDGKLSYRTMYPLRKSQLENYIKSGRAWKYEEKTWQ